MEGLFEIYIGDENSHAKYAKGEPALKGQEFHHYNEIVLFAEGASFFVSKNIQQELTKGSIIIIPKEHFHQFRVENPENYVRCILAFRIGGKLDSLVAEVMDRVKVISKPDVCVTRVFEGVMEVMKSSLSEDEKLLYIKSAIVQLLIQLKQHPSGAVTENVGLSPMVIQAISLIDEKYTEKLTVESIAEQLYVSPSTLAHKFSREMKISVYKYIIKKRISVAHQLAEEGETLYNAAIRSGFNDYSCFHRIYKKYHK